MGLPAPWLIGLVLFCFVVAAIPTRRLADAGIRPSWLTVYLLLLVATGVAVIAARGVGRYLVPFLVVLYIAPLVVAPETTARWLHRGRRPPKNVGSGPGRDVAPGDHPASGDHSASDDHPASGGALAPGPDDHTGPGPDDPTAP